MTRDKPKQPYIDSEGVRRGWYVYLHRDNESGQVFYVGKGIHRRAWNKTQRNDLWKARVASMVQSYSVEILTDNLSEIEADDLEKETIEKYGGIGERSPLTNQSPGGRLEVSLSIEDFIDVNNLDAEKLREMETALSLDLMKDSSGVKTILEVMLSTMDDVQLHKTMSTLQGFVDEHGPEILNEVLFGEKPKKVDFISPSRDEQLSLLSEFEKSHDSFLTGMQDFTKATMKSSIDCIYDFGATLDSESVSISELIVNVQKRRISWNDFCEEFVNRFHEIQWTAQTMMEDLNEIEQPTEIDISTGVEAIKLYASFLERIMK